MHAPEPTPRSKGRPLARGLAPRRVGWLLIVAVALLALLALGPGDDGSAERQRLITFAWRQDAPAELVWDLGDALEGPTDNTPGYPMDILALMDSAARPAEDHESYFNASNIADEEMADAFARLKSHMDSPAYAARVNDIETATTSNTGIVIPAGGARLTANLLVTLKVLREHFNCTLPIEVMWQNSQEMDSQTWSSIEQQFGPIRGVDIGATAHPIPRLHIQNLTLSRYTGKVYSLLVSNFRHVLLIDADSMPVQNPTRFFQHPQYLRNGNLFWPDAWTDLVDPTAYEIFGLNYDVAKEVLFQGKGYTKLDCESGQLLIDRARHLDVLEYLLWINSKPEHLQGYAWGDKDTFGLAFAVAGKAHMFTQVPVPPAGVFVWRKDMLLIKATNEQTWGWQLLGFLQHDSWGQPAFIHRTIDKFNPHGDPWIMQLITAPMPIRWSSYYLAHDNYGATKGVPWDYVVPASAVTELSLQPDSPIAQWVSSRHGKITMALTFPPGSNGTTWPSVPPSATCRDPDTFLRLWAMKESALPIDLDPKLMRDCTDVLRTVLGPQLYTKYKHKGWLQMPTMRYLDEAHMAYTADDWDAPEAATPLPAWRLNFSDPSLPQGPFVGAVRAAYQAAAWVRHHADLFPVLNT